jgi:hypothetical protein
MEEKLMNRLLIFGLGVLVGAGAVAYGPALARNVRPLLKEAIKLAIQGGHGARVKGAGLVEALEDIYAEVLAEASAAAAAAPAAKRRRARVRKHASRRRAQRAKRAEPVESNA